MPAHTVSFPAFVSSQLEELRLRLLSEFDRLHSAKTLEEAEFFRADQATCRIEYPAVVTPVAASVPDALPAKVHDAEVKTLEVSKWALDKVALQARLLPDEQGREETVKKVRLPAESVEEVAERVVEADSVISPPEDGKWKVADRASTPPEDSKWKVADREITPDMLQVADRTSTPPEDSKWKVVTPDMLQVEATSLASQPEPTASDDEVEEEVPPMDIRTIEIRGGGQRHEMMRTTTHTWRLGSKESAASNADSERSRDPRAIPRRRNGSVESHSRLAPWGSGVSSKATEGEKDVVEEPSMARRASSSHSVHRWATYSTSDGASMNSTIAENGVIYPASVGYRVWANSVSVLIVFSCFLAPFRFGFFEGVESMDTVGTALRCFFGADILIRFNVAVATKHGIATSRRKIFLANVLSSSLYIDIVATMPFDSLWVLFVGKNRPLSPEVVSALGLLRMLQVHHLLLLFRELQKNTYFNLVGVVVGKFVLFILLCTHTSGCIFYKLAQYGAFGEKTWVGALDPDLPEQSLSTRYMHVLFWAVGTFKAGPASGDLGPQSDTEMLLACLTMMVNICLQTYLVSNMAALLTTTDVRIYNMRNQLTQLRDFATRYKLPEGLHRQLRSFVRFKLSHNDEADRSVLEGLPDLYRQQVNHVLYEDIVKSVDIFHNCASLFLRQLHSSFKATLYMPHQQLATIDGPSSSLQIVAEGDVELLHRSGGIVGVCHAGECFTAVSFLCKVGQPFSVRTRMVCRVLSLSDSAWEAACTAFPQNLQRVKHNLLIHCEDKIAEFMPETTGFNVYTELMDVVTQHLVQQEELQVAMICSAAARGDVTDLKRRLVGATPNCSNYDARTPLHLAAAHGQVEVCRVLLDARSEVNPVDNFGRTPLLEACRARQENVAHLLFDRGASLGSNMRTKSNHSGGTTTDNGSTQSSEAGELCQAASDVEQLWYLRALLCYSANPNIGDYDARTALHVANASGNAAAVELLIGHPTINVNPRDNFGRTPLMEAVRHGHEACARLMKKRGAFHGFITDLKESTDANGIPAGQELCQAAFSNQSNYLHNLVTYCGINVDAADYDLRTALMLASAEGNTSVAVSLVQNKADIHLKDRWGHDAITEAEEHGHKDLANMLKLMDASIYQSR